MRQTQFILLRSLLLLFMTGVLNAASAQSYENVISSDSTSWDIAHQELFGIAMEKLYTKKHPDSTYSTLFIFGLYNDTTSVGSIREETNSGKIWYKDIFNTDEKLIMDMNLDLGDTFEVKPGIMSEVDSVFYYEGKKIIRFDLQTRWDESVMFIEGTGPNIGIFYPLYGFDSHYAACKYNQNTLAYVNSNANFDECSPISTGINDNSYNNKIQLYPNPAKSLLKIELPKSFRSKTEIEIKDISGKVILQKVFNKKTFALNVDHIKQGIYILTLWNGGNIYQRLITITN